MLPEEWRRMRPPAPGYLEKAAKRSKNRTGSRWINPNKVPKEWQRARPVQGWIHLEQLAMCLVPDRMLVRLYRVPGKMRRARLLEQVETCRLPVRARRVRPSRRLVLVRSREFPVR